MPARIDDEMRRRIAAASGEGDGRGTEAAMTPSTVDQLAAVAAICSDAQIPMALTSHAGGVPGAGVLISMSRLTRVVVDPGGLTVRAEAGAELAALRAAVAAESRVVVGLPGTTDARHVGSLVARGEVPRRSITGVELVLSTGEVVGSGGRVLKDVAGYDLAGLVLGSMGRAAIIVAVTLRIHPAKTTSAVGSPPRAVAGGSRVLRALDPGRLLPGQQ